MTSYLCSECGEVYRKWAGQCNACKQWNSIVSFTESSSHKSQTKIDFAPLYTDEEIITERYDTGFAEFNRVCGDGIVPGSFILLGGDPGIGKSTLLLQVAANLSKTHNVFYVSGEEGIDQVRMRAKRLGLDKSAIKLAAASCIDDVIHSITDKRAIVIIDSVQTMAKRSVSSSMGSIVQVRAVAQDLLMFAKEHNVCVILVSHVTKDGSIAGPRTLEHMVDTVLYFEGSDNLKILRTCKNRFGPSDEIGLFSMTSGGLMEVQDPSCVLLKNKCDSVPGSVVYAGIEGTRPMLVEIQSLLAPGNPNNLRRVVVGTENNRLFMNIAILEARCGFKISGKDIFLNFAGGIKVSDPGADLGICASMISALKNVAFPKDIVFFGELALTGELRPAKNTGARLKEAAKLGFKKAVIPYNSDVQDISNIVLIRIKFIHDIIRERLWIDD